MSESCGSCSWAHTRSTCQGGGRTPGHSAYLCWAVSIQLGSRRGRARTLQSKVRWGELPYGEEPRAKRNH